MGAVTFSIVNLAMASWAVETVSVSLVLFFLLSQI